MLVIMGIVIALVLSIASKSLSDTVLSRQERESSAAFSVAESGVEAALNSLMGNPAVDGSEVNISESLGFVDGKYKVTSANSYELYVRELVSAHLNLTGFNVANPLTISGTKASDTTENVTCGTEGSGTAPASIEVAATNGTTGAVTRTYYRGYNCTFTNGFAASNSGGTNFRSTISYSAPAGTTSLRIRPIYNHATISVTATNLPNQLYLINAKATGGDAQKEIEVRRGLDAPPTIFDFTVFTAGTIVKP
jgi:hypothetical protein